MLRSYLNPTVSPARTMPLAVGHDALNARLVSAAGSLTIGRYLLAILIMLLLAPANRAEEIKVKVVDQAGASGVMSRVLMSKDKDQDVEIEVGSTDGMGELAFEHTCMLGDQLFAEPLDDSYYRSGKEECGESVLLRVKKRQLPEDELVDRSRSVILVQYRDGTSKEYVAEYDGVMNDREVSLGGMAGNFCYTKLIFKLNRDVYRVEEDGVWLKDESESSSETLAKDRTKTRPSGSCAGPPEPLYRKVEDLGKERLRSKISKDLQGLLSRLQELKGVESVELQ